MTNSADKDPVCCPEFNPSMWDDKLFTWEKKMFVKDHVCTLFYMPVNFGQVMTRLNKKVEAAGATVPEWLCLSDHTSRWNMNLYLAVDKELPGVENLTLSGNFFSKVYEGPYRDTGKWSADFKALIKARGLITKKWYMWYTTCPKCTKKYGKNFVVIIAEV